MEMDVIRAQAEKQKSLPVLEKEGISYEELVWKETEELGRPRGGSEMVER